MEFADVVVIGQEMLTTALILSAPLLAFSLLAGLMMSVFQALTQINEIGLTFIIKIVAVALVLLFMLPWLLNVLIAYTTTLFERLPEYAG